MDTGTERVADTIPGMTPSGMHVCLHERDDP